MRRALPLLLLLASCEPRRNPRNIERALSAKTIDVEALEDLLAIEEGSLRLVQPKIPAYCVSPPDAGWFLENRGRRPVWLRRSDLKVRVDFHPFLPKNGPLGGRYGGGRLRTPPRPVFATEEWMLLECGSRVRLPLNAPVDAAGKYVLDVSVPNSGRKLCWDARQFNAGRFLVPDAPPSMIDDLDFFFLLPSTDWAGAPWHGQEPIDPVPLGGRRFELYTDVDAEFEESSALPLEAFIVDDQDRFVLRTPLRVEGHEAWPVPPNDRHGLGFLQNRAVYVLPGALPPGEYRMLVRTEDAESHFMRGLHRCNAPPGAASRWVPFRVE